MLIIKKLRKKILFSVLFAILVFALLSIYADLNQITAELVAFEWKYIPLILLLTILNYLLRFYKWDYYLSILDIHVSKMDSAIVFFSGLTMSVTPGKLGEVLKSYLLRQLDNISMSRTAPIVFAERLTDVVGLIILASTGSILFDNGKVVLVMIFSFIAVLLIIIQSRSLSHSIIGFGEKLPIVSGFAHHLYASYESAYSLLEMKPLFISILISILSWSFECIAMWYVLKGFGIDTSIVFATFAFAFSSMAGAVSMLPGGLGVAEGSIVGILQSAGISKAIAAAAALMIRFGTLWFGVFVGALTLALNRTKFENRDDTDLPELE
ncbi:MAG: lysylphosphatidylglycerol synthase transmembrane domain-containing protein [Methanolobus sp.]